MDPLLCIYYNKIYYSRPDVNCNRPCESASKQGKSALREQRAGACEGRQVFRFPEVEGAGVAEAEGRDGRW